MQFQRKQMIVDAIQLQSEIQIGDKIGKPGDYLVTIEGKQSLHAKEFFELHFEPFKINVVNLPEVIEAVEEEPKNKNGIQKPWETPMNSNKICIKCGKEKPANQVDNTAGICVDCLKQKVKCPTCNAEVFTYERVGTYCRKCLNNGRKVI